MTHPQPPSATIVERKETEDIADVQKPNNSAGQNKVAKKMQNDILKSKKGIL
jgi:hypothetical protein